MASLLHTKTRVPAYYNENDPKTAAWLRELIKAGLIADGVVDDRSIVDIQPTDLNGFAQCHFFAGIGGWSYALKLAGWPDAQPVWTGSCPCQPFSNAGKRKGIHDSRHLWPEFRRLIAECRPSVVFGEQVASAAGRAWLSTVRVDLEELAYAVGAADLCAAGIGAPHIRQRLWFVADSQQRTTERHRPELAHTTASPQGAAQKRQRIWADAGNGCNIGSLGEPNESGLAQREPEPRSISTALGPQTRQTPEQSSCCVGHPKNCDGQIPVQQRQPHQNRPEPGGPSRSHWDACDWLWCRDEKWRPVEPGTEPLAHGLPARVGRLRGYGNAIVPQVAAEFIGAYMDTL